jgi:hypothetical protein
MSCIQETKEYLEFIESKEYNDYLEEIQQYRKNVEDNNSGLIYNKLIDMNKTIIYIYC